MAGTIKMFCIRMNILSHRNNIVLFLACMGCKVFLLRRKRGEVFTTLSSMQKTLQPMPNKTSSLSSP